ncbi:hypothetical protein [Niabella aurantiaca]|uniref:hypothetical protein n=1 Tax=Niabella aurantiaca TaxID=379900 RepID=UPI000373967E|nr:hypothetical protein [Niabella aurantiaca]
MKKNNAYQYRSLKPFLMISFLFASLSVQAQPGALSERPGKITGLPANGIFKGVTSKMLNTTFAKILSGTLACKTLATPRGFEALVFTTVSKFQPQLGEKRHTGTFNIFLFNYISGKNGTIKKADEAPAYIKMYLNPEDFFTNKAGFFDAYDKKLKIPHPFQRIPVTDSTADYTAYSFKSYPFNAGYYRNFCIRILRRNPKPIFVAFTRKDYVQYLIAKEQFSIKETEAQITGCQEQIAQSKKNLKEPVFKNAQKAIEDGISIIEGTLRKLQTQKGQHQEQIRSYKTLLSEMPPGEAAATAYVDMESTRYSNRMPPYLVPYGRKEGWPLYIVNPDYYDNTQPPTKTQAIAVAYWYDQQFCPDPLKEKTRTIFEGIDYHQLKESMR